MKILPIIDFSNMNQETWSIKNHVREALEEYGCFEAKFDKITPHLQKSVLEGIQQIFDLPLETKLRNKYEKSKHGYIGQYAMVPLYESLGIQDALSPGKIDDFANLLWPQEGNSFFSKNVEKFAEQLYELDKLVRMMVVESLGLEKYMDEHVDSTSYVVRFQKYKGPGGNENKLGLLPHTDGGIITILYNNGVSGLEVLTKDGQWISAEPSPNSFIVMAGECFHAWTNGRVHCPYHRVTMTGDKDRYSIGVFSSPKAGYIIKAPAEMVDEEHPLLFKPFDHHEFTDFAYSEAGRSSKSVLKDFCGI